MLCKNAGAGSSASAQRNPLGICVTNGSWASRDRLWVGGVAGRSPLAGVAENARTWRLQPGEGSPQEFSPWGVVGLGKSGHGA
jgi:hypothetical protein